MAQRILIAEDNDRVAAFLEALLRHEGYATERTADGIETLQHIGRGAPDLLLLDLRLPRLHGVDLLKKLRKSTVGRDLPVIIATGVYRGERYARAAQGLGERHYLEKPFSAEALLLAVKDMLSSRQQEVAAEEGEPFDHHLYQAFSTAFSGTCHFEGTRGAILSFVAGTPVSLRPGFVHRDFGDYLFQNGRISADEYDYYQVAGRFRSDVLVQLGCLRYPELLQEKLAYLNGELIEAFSGPPLKVEQRPFPLSPGLQLFTLNMPSLFYRGYWRSSAPDTANPFPEDVYGQFVAPAAAFYRHVNFLDLNEEERRFVGQLDGSRTMAECLEGASGLMPLLRLLKTFGMLTFAREPLSPELPAGMPLRTLFNILEDETGASSDGPLESFSDLVADESRDDKPLVPSQPAPVALPEIVDLSLRVRQVFDGLQGKNYYQVFAMEQGKFSFDQLKSHYFRLTREFGPEAMMQLAGEEAGMVEEILATVTTAYNTLSDVIKKERYDELLGSDKVGLGQKGDDIFQSQVQFQSGKVFLDMEEWDNAEKALQDACNIAPKNGDYLAHLAWSIYRNPRNGSSPAMREKVRQMLNRALSLDRVPSAYAFKGWMLLDGGQDLLAEAEFSKALKLDARHALARRGLREITEKREQEKKGLFRRMFS